MESISLSLNPDFMEIIDRSRRRQEKEGGISSEEMAGGSAGRASLDRLSDAAPFRARSFLISWAASVNLL